MQNANYFFFERKRYFILDFVFVPHTIRTDYVQASSSLINRFTVYNCNKAKFLRNVTSLILIRINQLIGMNYGLDQ